MSLVVPIALFCLELALIAAIAHHCIKQLKNRADNEPPPSDG